MADKDLTTFLSNWAKAINRKIENREIKLLDTLTITEDGVYELSPDLTGTINVQASNVKFVGDSDKIYNNQFTVATENAKVCLKDINCNYSYFFIEFPTTGTKNELIIEGSCTITRTSGFYRAGINIGGGLKISGTGTLNINHNSEYAQNASISATPNHNASLYVGGSVTITTDYIGACGLDRGYIDGNIVIYENAVVNAYLIGQGGSQQVDDRPMKDIIICGNAIVHSDFIGTGRDSHGVVGNIIIGGSSQVTVVGVNNTSTNMYTAGIGAGRANGGGTTYYRGSSCKNIIIGENATVVAQGIPAIGAAGQSTSTATSSCGNIVIGGNAKVTASAMPPYTPISYYYAYAVIGTGGGGRCGNVTFGGNAVVNIQNSKSKLVGAGRYYDIYGSIGTIRYGTNAKVNGSYGTTSGLDDVGFNIISEEVLNYY